VVVRSAAASIDTRRACSASNSVRAAKYCCSLSPIMTPHGRQVSSFAAKAVSGVRYAPRPHARQVARSEFVLPPRLVAHNDRTASARATCARVLLGSSSCPGTRDRQI
jgi:hypothetical protein